MTKALGDRAKKVAVIADDRFADEQPRLAAFQSRAGDHLASGQAIFVKPELAQCSFVSSSS
ncbi:MAG: hypothetical protein JNM75_01595 [Rhodospirillales bacterium]|nr:hypothetical protein [Rhodospirillales bacterium]